MQNCDCYCKIETYIYVQQIKKKWFLFFMDVRIYCVC